MGAPKGVTRTKDDQAPKTRDPALQKEVSYNGKTYDTIEEGLAEILVPRNVSNAGNGSGNGRSKSRIKTDEAKQAVFYNPIQQYNRDLTVLAIKAFGEDLAAVRLAKQARKEYNLKQAEGRGKKRKRRGGPEEDQRKPARGDVESLPDADISNNSAPAVDAPRNEADYVAVQADGECDDYDEVQANTGAERQNGSDLQTSEAHSKVPEEEVATIPKGPKSKNDFVPPFRILDALSATGLRALRYAKEIPMTTSVTANDLSATAAESIRLNVAHNSLTSKVVVNTGDAIKHMHSTQIRTDGKMPQSYHVIDLDPYGTAAPFLDAAVRAMTDGGLLCVTCTDAGVFASKGYSEKTYSIYGGLPIKGPHAHEAGLRLILHAIATSAARYGIAIEPLLSLSIDFYARVFVRMHHSPADVKFLASKTMTVYQCDEGCGSWTTQFMAQAKRTDNRNGEILYKFTGALGPSAGKECEHCGTRTHLAGPMWGGALHNSFFVQRILDMLPDLDRETYPTIPRVEGMLTLALEEDLDDPWTSTAHTKDKTSKQSLPQEEHQPSAAEPTTTNDPPSTDHESTNPTLGSRPIPPLPAHYRIRHPFFIHPSSLARVLHTTTPSDASIRGALRHLGYLTSRSHTKAGSLVTNAPFTVIWEIMREWVRQDRSRQDKPPSPLKPNTAGARIMMKDREQHGLRSAQHEVWERIDQVGSVEDLKRELQAALYRLDNPTTTTPTTSSSTATNPPSAPANGPSEASVQHTTSALEPAPSSKSYIPKSEPQLHALDIRFDEQLGKDPRPAGSSLNKSKKMVRYQDNPRENWGPLGRASG